MPVQVGVAGLDLALARLEGVGRRLRRRRLDQQPRLLLDFPTPKLSWPELASKAVIYEGRPGPGPFILFIKSPIQARPYNFVRKKPYPGPALSKFPGPFISFRPLKGFQRNFFLDRSQT